MSWDDYTQAVLRLELPGGEIEVVPGAFGRVTGTFPGNGRPVHIITAHNPGGHLSSPDDNALAQPRLVARVAETALEHYPAECGDRAWEHVEPSLAVVGLDREQACALGRELGQDAIFEWSPGALAVLSCTDARAHYTGWVSTPVKGAGAQPSEEHAMVEDARSAAVPQLEPESPAAELDEETEYPSVGSPPDPEDYTREEFLEVYPEYEELAAIYFDDDEPEVSPPA
jgi:hypothetical protein